MHKKKGAGSEPLEPLGSSKENSLHVVVAGSGGKSSAIFRLVTGKFVEDFDPYIEDIYSTLIGPVHLDVFEVVADEHYNELRRQLEWAHVVVIVFDVTDRQSFEEADWVFSLATQRRNPQPLPCVLAGTQIDRASERKVTTKEGQAYASEHGVSYTEMSSKTGEGVTETFQLAIDQARLVLKNVVNENDNASLPSPKESFFKRVFHL